MEDSAWISSKNNLSLLLNPNVLGWSSQAKLVNLITRLQGQAYSLF